MNKRRGYKNNSTTNKKLVNLPIIIGRIRILLLLYFAFAKQPEWQQMKQRAYRSPGGVLESEAEREKKGMYVGCWIDMHDLRWEQNEFAKIVRCPNENVNRNNKGNKDDCSFKLQK